MWSLGPEDAEDVREAREGRFCLQESCSLIECQVLCMEGRGQARGKSGMEYQDCNTFGLEISIGFICGSTIGDASFLELECVKELNERGCLYT